MLTITNARLLERLDPAAAEVTELHLTDTLAELAVVVDYQSDEEFRSFVWLHGPTPTRLVGLIVGGPARNGGQARSPLRLALNTSADYALVIAHGRLDPIWLPVCVTVDNQARVRTPPSS